MRIANCEQSCCLSQHSSLRGRVCWQRRCYSVCKAVIPLLRSVLTSRVSSGAPGVPAALGAVHCRTPAMGVPSWPGAGCSQAAEITRVPGQRCQHRGHGDRRLRAPQRAAGLLRIRGKKSLSVRASAVPAPSEGPAQNTQPLLPLGQRPGSGSSTLFPHTRL